MSDDAAQAASSATLDLLKAMNQADGAVAPAVAMALPAVARVVDAAVERLGAGGRLFYIGAGTSGRLGVVDAAEWYPTFGVEHGLATGVIAGGPEAVFRSIEGAEDDAAQAAADLEAAGARAGDIVIGISASGTTPYMRGALEWARGQGIFTAAVVCHRVAAAPADVVIELLVGPEFVEGSSRLKGGTATKLVLNMISTVTMIRLGRVHAGRMVHLRTLSDKLRRRAQDIVAAECAISPAEAERYLADAGHEVKTAIIMSRLGLSAAEARARLQEHAGRLDQALGHAAPRRVGGNRGAHTQEPGRQIDLPALFADYAALPVRRIIGLMSGTSADAVHAALVEVSGQGASTAVRLVAFSHEPYQPAVRERILRLFEPECPAAHACEMNFALGEVFAQAALRLAEQNGGLDSVHLIASHGQTICHLPQRRSDLTPAGSTLQIGEPAVIAERTGVTTVADFRAADTAAGGEGAPLSPFADYVLFRHSARGRALQNIGGIANVTFLPPGCALEEVVAFDTGPGNMLIDAAAYAVSGGGVMYDAGGEMARQGRVNHDLLAWLMGHPFIAREPPKTAGREEFGAALADEFLARAHAAGLAAQDAVATATMFTVRSVVEAYRRFLLPRGRLDEVILGGGGAYNHTLREWLVEGLGGIAVRTHEDFGLPGHAKEALAFALLGNEAMLGRAAGLPNVTGARHPAMLGKIIPGANR